MLTVIHAASLHEQALANVRAIAAMIEIMMTVMSSTTADAAWSKCRDSKGEYMPRAYTGLVSRGTPAICTIRHPILSHKSSRRHCPQERYIRQHPMGNASGTSRLDDTSVLSQRLPTYKNVLKGQALQRPCAHTNTRATQMRGSLLPQSMSPLS